MTQEELRRAILRHQEWLLKLYQKDYGLADALVNSKGKLRLSNADLRNLSFDHADLRYAEFGNATLYGASFEGAILSHADLHGADLRSASFRCADLSNANLTSAVCNKTDFAFADMTKACLQNASFVSCSFRGSDMSYARARSAFFSSCEVMQVKMEAAQFGSSIFRGMYFHNESFNSTNLDGVIFVDSGLHGCDFEGSFITADTNFADINISAPKNLPYNIPMACPETGAFIGWKRCRDNRIVKLRIPASALRSSATGRKCRCSEARVLKITSIDGKTRFDCAVSMHDANFIYRVGETVNAMHFDTCRFNECASGIHFFITRDEAVHYNY